MAKRKGWKGERYRHSMAARGVISDADYKRLKESWDRNNVPINTQVDIITGLMSDRVGKETISAKKKLLKSNLAIDHLEDIHNLYVDYKFIYEKIPFNKLLDIDEIEKYKTKKYFLTYGEPADEPYIMSNEIQTTPMFDTKEKLNEWWLKNSKNLINIINSKKFKDNEKQFEKNMSYFDEYPNTEPLDKMQDMVEKYTKRPEEWYVNVYHADKGYGGAEEGGWWYDIREPLYTVRTRNNIESEKWLNELRKKYPRTGRRSNVNGGEDYDVSIQPVPGFYSPRNRPVYR